MARQHSVRFRDVTRRLWQRANTRDGRALAVLLGAALLVRLVPVTFPGFFADPQSYVTWGRVMDQHFWDFYSASGSVFPPAPYPPLSEYLFGLVTAAYSGLAHVLGLHPVFAMDHSPLLTVLMKLPIIATDLGAICVVYALARSMVGHRWAMGAAAAYAFSPTILFDGPIWGQVDSWYTLAVLLAFICTARRQGLSAGVCFGVSVMLKVQPAVLGPLMVLYLLRWAGWRQALRAVAGTVGVAAVSFLPYLLHPQRELIAFAANVNWVPNIGPYASISAYNLWWFLGDPYHLAATPYVGPLSANVIGWGLFGVVALVAVAKVWLDRSPEWLFLGAALLVTAFFTLTTLQHERYIYPALVLFLVAAVYNNRNVLFFGIVSVTSFLNLAIVVLAKPAASHPGLDVSALSNLLVQHVEYTLAIAAANICLLVTVTAGFVMSARSARAQGSPQVGKLIRAPVPVEQRVASRT